MWTLEYLDDLDADFLAWYGIDLERDDISGPRFFTLATRVFAYSGVMAARAENEREQDQTPRPPARQPAREPARETEKPSQYQSVAALAAQYPDEIELVKVQV